MMREVTTKEQTEHERELIKFCKKDLTNYCLMYSYMLTIKQIRKEPEDKLMDERLKKQADDYKRAEALKKAKELNGRAKVEKQKAEEFNDKTEKIVKEAKKLFKTK